MSDLKKTIIELKQSISLLQKKQEGLEDIIREKYKEVAILNKELMYLEGLVSSGKNKLNDNLDKE